jgi:hypothetical protein
LTKWSDLKRVDLCAFTSSVGHPSMAPKEMELEQKAVLETDYSNVHLPTGSDQGPAGTMPMRVDSIRAMTNQRGKALLVIVFWRNS